MFYLQDMESQIDLKSIEDIMWMEDEDFEKAIRDLNLKVSRYNT